jgi:4-amino-4-deoxy-L-arabinose transferase-like glycosyltransferase
MAEYWFKPKRYGYGATPVTWQGWAVTLGTVLAMVAVSLCLRLTAKSLWSLAALVLFDVAAIAALVIISYRKTDGGWRWRWGDR